MLTLREVGWFLVAVMKRWQAFVTGGLVVASLTVFERITGTPIPFRAFWWGIIVAFLMAIFLAWRDEYRKTRPGLKLTVAQFGIADGPTPNDSRVLVIASLVNLGTPSIADSWKLFAHIPGRAHPVETTPDYFDPTRPITLYPKKGVVQRIAAADTLYNKTMKQPIQTGMKEVGVLGFTLGGIPTSTANQVGAKFILQCNDVGGNQVKATHKLMSNNMQGMPMFSPGMTPVKPPN